MQNSAFSCTDDLTAKPFSDLEVLAYTSPTTVLDSILSSPHNPININDMSILMALAREALLSDPNIIDLSGHVRVLDSRLDCH